MSVRDIRTILRLTPEQGLSVREVAERLKDRQDLGFDLFTAGAGGGAVVLAPACGFDDDAALEQRLFHRMGRVEPVEGGMCKHVILLQWIAETADIGVADGLSSLRLAR